MIPALDLSRQYHILRGEIDAALARVLERGRYILSEEVAAFEEEFAAWCGARHAVGVGSGTDALHLGLLAHGIGAGDDVITVAHTSIATAAAIQMAGARPVFIDIDPAVFTLDPGKLESALTERTRAIIPVHLYGCPADLDPILAFARRHNLVVLEDCAQAHGALYRGKHVGTLGDAGAFSFYPTKNLGAFGDGGAVICQDPAIAERLRQIRQYGWSDGRISVRKGVNSRLDELQAAVLRVKLRHLDEWNAERRALARSYSKALGGGSLILPIQPDYATHVYHQFVIRHPRRDSLQAFLRQQGVETTIHYPLPVHLQPAVRDLGYSIGDLPATERASAEVLSLPLYPGMPEEHISRITEILLMFPAE